MGENTQENVVVEEKRTDEVLDNTSTETKEETTFTQEQVDKIVKDRLEKQKKSWEKEQSEAKKLAKMNADEKKSYEMEQKEKALLEREKEVIKRELTAEAKSILSEKGLPVELSDLLNYENAETVKESVENLAKQWEVAVQKGVADRIKGKEPITKAPENKPVDPFTARMEKYK